MKKTATCLRLIILSVMLLFGGASSFANHLVGMDLKYTYVSGNTYTIILIAYGDCGSAATTPAFGALSTNTPEVYIYNGASLVSTIHLAIQAPSAGVEITPVCDADRSLTQCTDPTFAIPGIKKFVYTANYTFSGTSADWRVLFTGQLVGSLAGRSTSITNISSSPDSYIELVDTLNNTVTHNSNPNLTNVPTPFFCVNNADNYNPGAVDPDGDSLIFSLVDGQSGSTTSSPGGLVTYVGGATGTNPLAATTSWSFDLHTGQISFYTTSTQRALVVYNIDEYHNGAFRGSSQREMTFLVQTCSNTPPAGTIASVSAGIIVDSTHFQTCLNSGPFTISIDPTEAVTTNNITVTYTGLPAGATLTVVGNGTPTPHITVAWTSTGVAAGVYTFYVTYTDNNCPLSGTQTIAYTMSILPQPTVTYTLLAAPTCTRKGAITISPSGGGSPWAVKLSVAGDTVQSFTGITGSFTDSITPGSYILTVYSTGGNGCKIEIPVTIASPVSVALAPTFTNPTYCGASDGTLTLHNLTAGETDTVKYSYNGVVQPSLTLPVSSSGTITLTGLTAGVYSSITASFGYCISMVAGPETLRNPSFTMRALTSTNPIFCGICNGTITLYGLHPGQTDSISYTLGGVFEPTVVSLIPGDSQVTITGLCAGVYANFVAKTAGVCVSNTLGPVTLSVPPFTMRAISSVNPDYCGVCNGSITLYGLHPDGLDTISYTLGGVVEPRVPFLVPADSTVTISGLCAGTYANFVAHAGSSCVSNTLGPVTLTVPPFTMRAITSVNPSYCGVCDGSVTLYGLHPGETDSIHYTFNGVAQTPFVAIVPADSQIIITGLCAGVYASFVAHTGGVCVSNTLGPVTLTVPPFTMRAISSTNPDYCGICNGTITLYGLHPGETDSIHFDIAGVAQTPFVQLVPDDSIISISGLCAGNYSNFVAQTGGNCVSNILGPVSLTVPPFTMRAISRVNPTKCGFCTGSVTLYGLHPGQTDTINYAVNGVPFPPLSFVIGADSQVTISSLCDGVYSNFVANTGGVCFSNALGPVTLKAPPIIPAFTDALLKGCQGDTLLITNDSWPASDLTYRWFFGDGDSSTDVNPTHIYHSPGIDSVTLYITNTKCDSSVAEAVVLDNLINANFTAVPDQFVCQGNPVAFTNTSTGTLLTYLWIFGDGALSTNTNETHVYKNSGVYTVLLSVSNYVPCYDTARLTLAVDSISSISLAMGDSVICEGTALPFHGYYASSGLTSIIWGFGNGDSIRNVNPVSYVFDGPGVYSVYLKAYYRACPDTSVTREFQIYGQPVVNLGGDTSICPGSTPIYISDHTNAGNKNASWVWSNGETSPGINIVEPGQYYVKVTVNGCTTSDSILVKNDCFMDIPNAFSPNGDGMNDYFFPRTLLTSGLISFSMQIYNRWGQEIFATTTLDGRGWDGRFNDTPQPEGVYIYKIDATFKDGQKEHRQGNITLLR